MKLHLASITLLCLLLVIPVLIGTANVQAQNNYYITIKPADNGSPCYVSAGHNCTVAFSANYSYGNQNGAPVRNATVNVEVRNSKDHVLDNLKFNTTTGVFAFNYSSEDADILTFTPTRLTTQDTQEYTVDTVDSSDTLYGLMVEPTVVWYDTFHVSLVNFNTDTLGKTVTTVNVTYTLLPEEGLTLYNQTFLPKIIHNATITINGVTATETQPGIFTAESSSILDTAYVNVRVSQDGWLTTETAFSFAQHANQQIWMYGVAFVSVLVFAALALHYAVYRKANGSSSHKHSSNLFYGFILLIVTSILSLYWGITGVEGTLHTFAWLPLALVCLFSFVLGTVGSIFVLKKTRQALAILAATVPLIVNTIIVKTILNGCQLAFPLFLLLSSIVLSVACIFLVSGSDVAFKKTKQATKTQKS